VCTKEHQIMSRYQLKRICIASFQSGAIATIY
jgi:hypothetical protein